MTLNKMIPQHTIDKPALILAAFGSSRRGKAIFELFHEKVAERYKNHSIYWGYTSRIICRKTGKPNLHQTLLEVKSAGFRQAILLPLQIFPGAEYQNISAMAINFSGLEIVVGETLMHRWKFVKEVLNVVEKDFAGSDQALNLLALHGSPLAGDPANSICLGLEKLVTDRYDHVMVASLEGVPDHEAVFRKMKRSMLIKEYQRVRILPLLFSAGLHVEDDLMGKGPSWKDSLEKIGFEVECPVVEFGGERFYKSLACYPEVLEFFLQRLERSLTVLHRNQVNCRTE